MPHFLVMTATPIPRSLALTVYGHLDVSVLDEKPAGRGAVRTVAFTADKRREALELLVREISAGKQAYIVAPLVHESEQLEARGAVELFHELRRSVLADIPTGLLHGRMKSLEKEETLRKFHGGDIRALVCTTVIEVGLDAPGAGVVMIDGAERFGLAQLHQLRGRVGRGRQDASCILVVASELTPEAEQRIDAMLSSNDGFELAERDLSIRGPGELFGPRQHGQLAGALTADPRLVLVARDCAETIMKLPASKRDPLVKPILSDLERALVILEAG
jgi:ATP-dependent DNA helicase RecG